MLGSLLNLLHKNIYWKFMINLVYENIHRKLHKFGSSNVHLAFGWKSVLKDTALQI